MDNGDDGKKAWLAMQLSVAPEFTGRQGYTVFTTSTGDTTGDSQVVPVHVRDFKKSYTLLGRSGQKANCHEPFPDRSEEIDARRRRKKREVCVVTFILLALIIFLILFRLFLWRCWVLYEEVTLVNLNGLTWPATKEELENAAIQPSHDQVLETCHNPPNGFRPRVFEHWAREYNFKSVPCFHGVCKMRDQFVEYRVGFCVAILVLLALFAIYVCHDPDAHQDPVLAHADEEE